MPLDPQARFVLDQLAAQGGMELHELTPEAARRAFASLRLPIPAEPVAHVENRSIPGPDGAVPVRVYRSAGAATPAAPGLVYFHGGGWVIGDLESHDDFCRALANRTPRGRRVGGLPARARAPLPRRRRGLLRRDALGRRDTAPSSASTARASRSAGDSAGGNLAAVVALLARDRGGPSLRHPVLIYPVADHDFETPSYRDNADRLPAHAREHAVVLGATTSRTRPQRRDDPRVAAARREARGPAARDRDHRRVRSAARRRRGLRRTPARSRRRHRDDTLRRPGPRLRQPLRSLRPGQGRDRADRAALRAALV